MSILPQPSHRGVFRDFSQLHLQKNVRTAFSVPEGQYELDESACYSHPSGKMFFCSQLLPVTAEVLSTNAEDLQIPSAEESLARRHVSQLPVLDSEDSGKKKSRGRKLLMSRKDSKTSKVVKTSEPKSKVAALLLDGMRVIWFGVFCTLYYYPFPNAEGQPMELLDDLGLRNAVTALKSQLVPASEGEEPSALKVHTAVGFSGGEVLYRDLISRKAMWFNQEGVGAKAPVNSMAWSPDRSGTLLCGHSGGQIFVYSLNRGDVDTKFMQNAKGHINSENPKHMPPALWIKNKSSKSNPIGVWRVGRGNVHCMEFSPNGRWLAIGSADGWLRVFDWPSQNIYFAAKSYFGAVYCVSWSPDNIYLAVGGEDDVVTVYDFEDRQLIARGLGHDNWISGVKFDPWLCDDTTYRIASVGFDCKLVLWDFSLETLSRPKHQAANGQGSISATKSSQSITAMIKSKRHSHNPITGKPSITDIDARKSDSKNQPLHPTGPDVVELLYPKRREVAIMASVMEHKIHHEPLTDLNYTREGLMTVDCAGVVKFWTRPASGSE
eukprot:Clim_evm51s207 gene=Clim_evmTU51s207